MRILLIATTSLTAKREADLARMLGSLAQQRIDGALDVRLNLLVQSSTARPPAMLDAWSDFVDVATIPTNISLSRARNFFLAPLLASGRLDSDTLVLYPDDDCWFEPGYLARVVALFKADPELGCWFCDYGPEPDRGLHQPLAKRAAHVRDVVRMAASITLAVRGDVALSVGLFDEDLGIGAANPGGEDVDYAIRAFLASSRTRVTALKLMGHRDRSKAALAPHFEGCLIAIAKHSHRHVGLAREFVRKVAVGGVLVGRGELSADAFARALGKATLSWRRRSTPASVFGGKTA